MDIFDSHCHLTDAAFDEDREATIARARAAGVTGVVTIASDAADAERAAALAAEHPDVWCTAGIHPHVSESATDAARSKVRDLLDLERVVAVGETGLDYHYDNSPRAVQRRSFDWHLEVAAHLGLPVVVHSRDAEDDTIAALRATGPDVRGVLHCFSASSKLLEAGLAADWYVSFAGLITFKRFDGADLLRAVPADRLLLETDAPYLAPVPQRGRRNEPALLAHTVTRAAEVLNDDPEAVGARTAANARRFYGLPGGS